MPIFLILIFLIPFQTHPLLSQSIGGFTVIKWVGLFAVVVAFVVGSQSSNRARLLSSAQAKAFILLLLLVAISWAKEGNFVFTHPLQISLSFAIFFFVTLNMVNSVERARMLVWAVVVCMMVASLYMLKEYLTYSRYFGIGYRPSGSFGDPNYFALSLLVAMPLLYYLFKTTKGAAIRLLLYFSSVLYVVSFVLALSRGAFVGLAGMLIVILLLSKRKKRTLGLLSLVFVIGLFFAPDTLWKRFSDTSLSLEGPSYGTVASTTRRLYLFKAGVAMIAEHPIKGVGLGQFKSLSTLYEPKLGGPGVAHNTYLELAAELGLPAATLFLLIILFTYRDLLRLRRAVADDKDAHLLTNVLIVSLTGFVFAAAFVSGYNTKLFWLLVFFSIAFKWCVTKNRSQARKPVEVEEVAAPKATVLS